MSGIERQVLVLALMMGGGPCFFRALARTADKPIAVKAVARVSKVMVTGGGGGLEVEISATRSVAVRSQVTTNPDRLILDFPDALPGPGLRNQAINRGAV